MNLSYCNLEWALDKNDELLKTVFKEYSNNTEYLQILDDLICFLKINNCKNIQEKFRMGSRLIDFDSNLSELKVGEYFVKKGYKVNFIPEISHVSLPDLFAYTTDSQIFVEVKKIIEDNYLRKLIDYLTHNIDVGFSVSIGVHLNQELYNLALTKNDKDKKQEIISLLIDQFEQKLVKNEFIDNLDISTTYGWFTVRKNNWQHDHNIVVIGSISPQLAYNDVLINKIKRDVILKAEKKGYLKNSHPDKEILIALVCDEQHPFTPDFKRCLELALFGTNNNGIFYQERTMRNIDSVVGADRKGFFSYSNPNSGVQQIV